MAVTSEPLALTVDAGPTTFFVFNCAECGVLFAITTEYKNHRRADGQEFYCPNGHPLSWKDTPAKRLERQLAETQTALAATRASLAATEKRRQVAAGVATRLRRRAQHGLCAYCKRTFADYARHMQTKHPDRKEPTHGR